MHPQNEAAIAAAPYTRRRRTARARGRMRPRVLELLATGGTGGAQQSYAGLVLGLDRARYEVRALSLGGGSSVRRMRALGVELDVLDQPDDAAAVRELAALLRREEIDLLHAHMHRAEIVGIRAGVAAGTPVIVATVHSSRVRSADDVAALASLTPHLDRLILPSSSIESKVRAEGRDAVRLSVIPNGIDVSRFTQPAPACALRADHGIGPSAPLIGVVARLEAEKGHRYLIEAMPRVLARHPAAWLAIVGEGAREAELRAIAAALPDWTGKRVVFAGARDDISALTADLTVAVLPSLREAQGIALMEAMARGVPVVASAVGGIPEVITHGVDGLLVPPRDSRALGDAIATLLDDAMLRQRLGAAGRRTVMERFSVEAQVRRTQEVYDEELARAGIRPAPPSLTPVRAEERSAPSDDRAALEIPPR